MNRLQEQKAEFFKVIDEKGELYLKYRVLDSSVDGNGHGVSRASIPKNIPSGLGKPFIEVPKTSKKDGKYTKYHPYSKIYNTTVENELKASAEFTKGIIEDYSFESKFEPRANKDSAYYTIHITNKEAAQRYRANPKTIPPEVSLAMIVYDVENEPHVNDWEIVHLAGIANDSNGAYPNMIPVGGCVGNDKCINELKASAKTKDSFHIALNKKDNIEMTEKNDSEDKNKNSPLNKFKVGPKGESGEDKSKQKTNAPTGGNDNGNDDRFSKLESGMNQLTELVTGLVKRNEDSDKAKRESAIKELIPESLVGKIYPDKDAWEKDIKEKVESNHSVAEVSEIINNKVLGFQAVALLNNNPEAAKDAGFDIPKNMLVGSERKEMSREEKIARARSISSFYGNDGVM